MNRDGELNNLIDGFCQQLDKRCDARPEIIRNPSRLYKRVLAQICHMSLIYLCLVAVQIASFVYHHKMSLWLVANAIPFGMLLGMVLYGFNQMVNRLRALIYNRMGKVLAGFLLFFFCLISYILIFTVVVSYPVGWIIEHFSAQTGTARGFELYSINFIILFSIMSWLDWLRRTVCLENK